MHGRADLEDVRAREVRLVAERAEDRIFLVEQRERRVELRDAPRVHNEDAVVVHCDASGRVSVGRVEQGARRAGSGNGRAGRTGGMGGDTEQRRTDGVEPVCDAQQRGRGELGLDRTLDLGVCLDVDAARRLVLRRM